MIFLFVLVDSLLIPYGCLFKLFGYNPAPFESVCTLVLCGDNH